MIDQSVGIVRSAQAAAMRGLTINAAALMLRKHQEGTAMDRRRRRVVLLAAAGVVVGGCAPLLGHMAGSFAGLPAAFWRGFPIGLGISFDIAALVEFVKWKRERAPCN